jgi:DNA repair protein RadC
MPATTACLALHTDAAVPADPENAPGHPEVPLPVYRVQLERTGSVLSTSGGHCRTAQEAEKIVRSLIGEPDREHFVGIYLDAQYAVLALQVLAIGDRFSVAFTAAELYKTGLLCNALGIVLAHNHPSGDSRPSKEDCEITGGLEVAGAMIGIQLIDHIVVGSRSAVSMRQANLMLIPMKEEFETESFLTDVARRTRRRARAAAKKER